MKTKQAIFDQLIEESLPMLRNTAYGILGNTADADDAVQEALVKAWKGFSIFQSRSKLSSWVYRITVNVAYDMQRKQQRETQNLKDYTPEDGENSDNEAMIESLTSAIAELPDTYREALTIVYYGGVSGDTAAKQLGCNLNTFYWRISRAKEMLYDKLKDL